MKRLLGILLFFLFLGTVGLAAGIYFKVLPPSVTQKIPFVSQYVSVQNSSNDSSKGDQEATAPQQLPIANDNSNNAQPVTQQNVANYQQDGTSATINSNSPNNKNKTNPNISKVSRIYSGMKPEEAVAILNDLDDKTVITMLQKMNEDQVAKILALMDSQRAAVLSKLLLKNQAGANSNNN